MKTKILFSSLILILLIGCSTKTPMPEMLYYKQASFLVKMDRCKEAGYLTSYDYTSGFTALSYIVNTWDFDEQNFKKKYTEMEYVWKGRITSPEECENTKIHNQSLITDANNHRRESQQSVATANSRRDSQQSVAKANSSSSNSGDILQAITLLLQGVSQAADMVADSYNRSSENMPTVQPINYPNSNQSTGGCTNDYQCGGTLRCVKAPMASRGQCVQPVNNTGRPVYIPPSPSSNKPNINPQGQCVTNAQCPANFNCDRGIKLCVLNKL